MVHFFWVQSVIVDRILFSHLLCIALPLPCKLHSRAGLHWWVRVRLRTWTKYRIHWISFFKRVPIERAWKIHRKWYQDHHPRSTNSEITTVQFLFKPTHFLPPLVTLLMLVLNHTSQWRMVWPFFNPHQLAARCAAEGCDTKHQRSPYKHCKSVVPQLFSLALAHIACHCESFEVKKHCLCIQIT